MEEFARQFNAGHEDEYYMPDPFGRLGKRHWIDRRRKDPSYRPRKQRRPEPELAFDLNTISDLTGSIGNEGRNNRRDVAKVETLLESTGNADLSDTGGPTGYFGLYLDDRGKRFQKKRGLRVDGTINPGGPTIHSLAEQIAEKSTANASENRPAKPNPLLSFADGLANAMRADDEEDEPPKDPPAPEEDDPDDDCPELPSDDEIAEAVEALKLAKAEYSKALYAFVAATDAKTTATAAVATSKRTVEQARTAIAEARKEVADREADVAQYTELDDIGRDDDTPPPPDSQLPGVPRQSRSDVSKGLGGTRTYIRSGGLGATFKLGIRKSLHVTEQRLEAARAKLAEAEAKLAEAEAKLLEATTAETAAKEALIAAKESYDEADEAREEAEQVLEELRELKREAEECRKRKR